MHELSLCRAMLDLVNEHVAGKEIARVTSIALEVGQLAAIDESALRFSFDVVTKGTVAENARLDIIRIEGQASCSVCKKTITLKRYYDACPLCDNFSLTVTQGEELRLRFLEVE